MATTKFLKDANYNIPTLTFVNGVQTNSTPQSRLQRITASADWSRPMPPVRDVTGFVFTQTIRTIDRLDGRNESGTGFVGTAGGQPATTPSWSEPFTGSGAAALTRAQARLYNRHTSLGETLVELDQASKMIGGALRRIDRILVALFNGNRKKIERTIRKPVSKKTYSKIVAARKAGKTATDGALAIQYGWLPLVQLIEDTVKIYLNGLYQTGDRVAMSSGTQRVDTSRIDSGSKPSDYRAGGRASIHLRVRNPNLANLNGLGLLNPLREAWNRVGLSFVFDWFIPVGTFMASATASAGMTFLYGSSSNVSGSFSGRTFRGEKVTDQYFYTATRRAVIGFIAPSLDVLWTGSGLATISQVLSFAALAAQRSVFRK